MVSFQNVTREFSGPRRERVLALNGFNLEARPGELLVIVGPSGCGKTTALRLLAGLDVPDRGSIFLDGQSLAGVEPRDRDLAMVFQHHALLPHLTVWQNMAFGLTLRKFPAAEITARVGRAAEMLGLTALLERRPGAISGGERQRAALGRALARQPKVFLFDEPLSHLDAPARLQLRGEIAALRRRLGATMLFVTHDQAEALALADRLAVMRQGAVEQAAPPEEIYRRPASRFVAGFIGAPAMNFFEGTLAPENGALWFRGGGVGEGLAVAIDLAALPGAVACSNKPVTLGLRPEHILEATGSNGALRVEAVIERTELTGPERLVYLRCGAVSFVGRWPASHPARAGDAVAVEFPPAQAHLFDGETGRAI